MPFDTWIMFLKSWSNLVFLPPSVHFWCWVVSGFPTLLPVRAQKPQKCSRVKFVHQASIPAQEAGVLWQHELRARGAIFWVGSSGLLGDPSHSPSPVLPLTGNNGSTTQIGAQRRVHVHTGLPGFLAAGYSKPRAWGHCWPPGGQWSFLCARSNLSSFQASRFYHRPHFKKRGNWGQELKSPAASGMRWVQAVWFIVVPCKQSSWLFQRRKQGHHPILLCSLHLLLASALLQRLLSSWHGPSVVLGGWHSIHPMEDLWDQWMGGNNRMKTVTGTSFISNPEADLPSKEEKKQSMILLS